MATIFTVLTYPWTVLPELMFQKCMVHSSGMISRLLSYTPALLPKMVVPKAVILLKVVGWCRGWTVGGAKEDQSREGRKELVVGLKHCCTLQCTTDTHFVSAEVHSMLRPAAQSSIKLCDKPTFKFLSISDWRQKTSTTEAYVQMFKVNITSNLSIFASALILFSQKGNL